MARTVLILTVMVVLVAAAPAAAQNGNGPYSPFPTPLPASRTSGFYGALDETLTLPQIKRGAFRAGLTPTAATTGPSRRAEVDVGTAGVVALLGALAAALLVAGVCQSRRGALRM